MRPSLPLRLRPLALALAFLLALAVSFPSLASGAPCGSSAPLSDGDVLNVAVLAWVAGAPYGPFHGDLAATPATDIPGFGTSLIQPAMLGMDMYMKKMRARGGLLPLASGASVRLNFTVINLADPRDNMTSVNYGVVDAASGVPMFVAVTAIAAGFPGGLYDQLVSQDPSVLLASFGVSEPFKFIIPPVPLIGSLGVHKLLQKVEDAGHAIVVHPFLPGTEDVACDGSITPPPEALSCAARGLKDGARRYKSLFSVLFESEYNQNAALDMLYQQGVRRLAALSVGDPASLSFGVLTLKSIKETAEQLNMQLVLNYTITTDHACPTFDECRLDESKCAGPAHCPPMRDEQSGQMDLMHQFQNLVFPDGLTGVEAARRMRDAGVDGLHVIIGSTAGYWAVGQLWRGMKAIGWQPKLISFGGNTPGLDVYLPDGLRDLDFTLTTQSWDSRLKGPAYKARTTESNFELLPGTPQLDAPLVFDQEYNRMYGPGSGPGGAPNPHWFPSSIPGAIGHVLGWQALYLAQKLVEASMDSDRDAMVLASYQLSTPSAFHQAAFDRYGRVQRVNHMLLQQQTDGSQKVISPVNIGAPLIYPLPTWQERVFQPKFYERTGEKVLLAINSIAIVLCLGLLAFVLYWRSSAVIRAATASFSVVIIIGGVVLLCSNYFATSHVNDAHCAASTWLLTIGWTIMYAAIFIKTFRVWRIFGGKRLSVIRLKDSTLLLALSGFMLVDVIINAVWMGSAGMPARRVQVDPHRPSLDYMHCDFSEGIGAVYAHLVIKGGMLVLGVMLVWAVRKTPSQFNESTLIGASTYNAAVVCAFIVPLIAVELGGRETAYLVRAFAIMFLVLSTLALLYVPKMMLLLSSSSPANRIAALEMTDASALRGTGSVLDSPSPKSPTPMAPCAGAYAVSGSAGRSSGMVGAKGVSAPPQLVAHKSMSGVGAGVKEHSKHRSQAPSSRGTPPSQVDEMSEREAAHAHAGGAPVGQGWANANVTPTLVQGENVVSPTAKRDTELLDERGQQHAAPPGQVNVDMH